MSKRNIQFVTEMRSILSQSKTQDWNYAKTVEALLDLMAEFGYGMVDKAVKRETERADRLEAEVTRLNVLFQDTYIPRLEEATQRLKDSTEEVDASQEALGTINAVYVERVMDKYSERIQAQLRNLIAGNAITEDNPWSDIFTPLIEAMNESRKEETPDLTLQEDFGLTLDVIKNAAVGLGVAAALYWFRQLTERLKSDTVEE